MEKVILNCDIGENESDFLTESILGEIDAASICCGVHAGSLEKTGATLRSALEHGCVIGAHPGLALAGGRGALLPDAESFKALLFTQMTSFLKLLEAEGGRLAYIKLHGSLYHGMDVRPDLAEVYLDYLKVYSKEGVGVVARAGGEFAEDARAEGIQVFEELFADRAYLTDGSLVHRDVPGALLQIEAVEARIRRWMECSEIQSLDGQALRMYADTICVHVDTVDSLKMVRTVRQCIDHYSI